MDRLACLELPAFALQLLLRTHAQWRSEPAAVVDRDAAQGIVLACNAAARASGVRTGLRYAAALALCTRLRAGALDAAELDAGTAELVRALQRFSPDVEACTQEAGVFWLDARGLGPLFGEPRAWASAILAALRGEGFEAKLALGFRRFGAYAAVKALDAAPASTAQPASSTRRTQSTQHEPPIPHAHSTRPVLSTRPAHSTQSAPLAQRAHAPRGAHDDALLVLDDPAHETRVALGVELARLSIEPDARDALAKLAIRTLGELARLPSGGLLQRFGEPVQRLHRLANGVLEQDLAPAQECVPLRAHVDLDDATSVLDALLAHVEELARPLCAELEADGRLASAWTLRFALADRGRIEERLVPARATCELAWWMRLVRLRLGSLQLSSEVARIELELERAAPRALQATLFVAAKQRPAAAAAKAFSALRAALGARAVVSARLLAAHLPEQRFAWERCLELVAPRPRERTPQLVRRFLDTPIALPPRGRREPDGWLLRGVTHGAVVRLLGPYRSSGDWWSDEVRRDSYFAVHASGETSWIFYDLVGRSWFLQGSVS